MRVQPGTGLPVLSSLPMEKEIRQLVEQWAPALLALPGFGSLTAAKIIRATVRVDRFKSGDAHACYNGTTPCRCGRRTKPGTACAGPETVG